MDVGEEGLTAVLPADGTVRANDWHYLRKLPELLGNANAPVRLLDLGAGDAGSLPVAAQALGAERLKWTGVDIEDSLEHLNRPADAPPIDVYDGVELPYANAAFDAVWCKQVLEHIRYPDTVIAEVVRVLDEGGLFLGSVSQLEPYHSRSIFNWTHYGIRTVFADHGLEVLELTPGVDGTLLIMRALFGYDTGLNKFFAKETPLNQVIDAVFSKDGLPDGRNAITIVRNRMKVAGHIHFVARKAGGA
jgi:SAM-dependent methyltransferase